ncbi:type II toxin-antitoxin system HigB family toxin [Rudaea sp.]|uniref:type II toxin-antitoxin system HigB family toxin n=1 Tax=Rudaea sp. TaxID=2136325 RepID=UPI002ED04842
MRLIALKSLREFWARHPQAEQPLRAWADEVRQARWKRPADIKAQFASASILKSRRVVFNIKGNDYRVVTAVAYRFQAVYVKFVGTHAEYDEIDADEVESRS